MANPADEAARLAALRAYSILDTEPESGFDDLARLAASLCATPIALVSFVDDARQWFKARVGLGVVETGRDLSFCAHAIREDGLFVVRDASADGRFAANPLVTGDPGIRFYAGAPLVTPDGHALGTLCVIDRAPRDLSPAQAEALEGLGRQVVAQLELRRARADARLAARTLELAARAESLRRAEEDFRAIFENAVEGIYQTTPCGRYLRANPALARIYGYASPEELIASLEDIGGQLYVDPGRREEFRRLVDERDAIADFESRARRKDGRVIWISEKGRAVRDGEGRVIYYEGTVSDITDRRLAEAEIRALNGELAAAYDATIEGWAKALDLRDKETEGHTRRVTEMSLRLGRALGLGEEALVHVRRGALLHDIGKLGVPDAVLLKAGPLTEEEWAVMRRHPTNARDWLCAIPVLRPALEIPYGHHEKWDGTGYPQGLAGEEIPLAARLFAVVDIWDALRSDRPYRAAMPEDRVRAHLRSLAGSHLDPAIVAAFLRILDEVSPAAAAGDGDVAFPATTTARPAAVVPGRVHKAEGRAGVALRRRKAGSSRRRELERDNARLAHLVLTDDLTGLRNRRHFREMLQACFDDASARGLPLSVVLLDLDGFKAYNDEHGHSAGDDVLRDLAILLRFHMRSDDVVARHGGEEFAALLPATDADGARAWAERLRAIMARHRWPLTPVTASFGLSTLTPATRVAFDLVEQADRAMYHAKRNGRDRVAHFDDLLPPAEDGPTRARDLSAAC